MHTTSQRVGTGAQAFAYARSARRGAPGHRERHSDAPGSLRQLRRAWPWHRTTEPGDAVRQEAWQPGAPTSSLFANPWPCPQA